MSMKNFNDTNWNRTSDLPICSTAQHCATVGPKWNIKRVSLKTLSVAKII